MFLSFDGWNVQWLQILHEWRAITAKGVLLAVFRTESISGVKLVEMRLESLFQFVGKSGKLDSHSHAGIARAHDRAGRETFLFNP
jgi:hypothetical protein